MEAALPQHQNMVDQILALDFEIKKRFETVSKIQEATAIALDKLEKQTAKTDKKVADITDTLGKYVEEQIRPKAISEFKRFGVYLNESHQRVTNDDEKGNKMYEIDLLLVNTEFAVAIESKSKLSIDDVNAQLKRLDKIKTHPTKGLRNIKLLGGVAGMIVPENVLEYAKKKGLFVFIPSGETVKIANQDSFEYKTWETI